MKKFAWFCVILACAALALAAAYIFSSRLNVVSEVRVVPAAYMQKDFDELLASGQYEAWYDEYAAYAKTLKTQGDYSTQ